jgi:hypothetical protein
LPKTHDLPLNIPGRSSPSRKPPKFLNSGLLMALSGHKLCRN